MRIEVKLRPVGEDPILPFNYNYEVYRQIVGKINTVDPEMAREVEISHVDHFTFSRVLVRKRDLLPDRGIRILSDTVSLYIASHSPEVIKSIVEGFMASPAVRIGKTDFIAEDVKPIKEPVIKDGMLFSTLSPIMVRTVKFTNDRMKIWDLYPSEPAFFDKLRKVMILRYSELYGRTPDDSSFSMEVIKFKPVRILVADTYYRGSLMIFRYFGSREIARFGYDLGFGEKTKYGFGMVKVIDEEASRTDRMGE
ncbi:CRISPR-associated endoribonuclease Cas6 [Thermococcus sp. Bubb.Bath]|uniref:CRISPR-associated endoribonuclease Cas6 n=1 Tax=Thermococcus sp. Bubb.Bath TaxID=1638242 RepID=UPI001438B493|nr:CRISPR-associated endoribonuclease Cas6 [Thermococcus sp. Bubb.Bath]NJF24741.1 CRISPR-associated endoribonuclease Cas6 [Thermococcus sp. Bubb.Bath]